MLSLKPVLTLICEWSKDYKQIIIKLFLFILDPKIVVKIFQNIFKSLKLKKYIKIFCIGVTAATKATHHLESCHVLPYPTLNIQVKLYVNFATDTMDL